MKVSNININNIELIIEDNYFEPSDEALKEIEIDLKQILSSRN
tara:strand:+ start:505 stop:633 length:129 start_codon:yes stop_codon:yes gene_type:complete